MDKAAAPRLVKLYTTPNHYIQQVVLYASALPGRWEFRCLVSLLPGLHGDLEGLFVY